MEEYFPDEYRHVSRDVLLQRRSTMRHMAELTAD